MKYNCNKGHYSERTPGGRCEACLAEWHRDNPKEQKLVCGVGVMDLDLKVEENKKCRALWASMLRRCYDEKFIQDNPTYIGCTVAPEWHTLSKFKEWWDANYQEGYELDKDVLVQGNKEYSPVTARYIPRQINRLFGASKSVDNGLPYGVSYHKPGNKNYVVQGGKFFGLGSYFATLTEAEGVAKKVKKYQIKATADLYLEEGWIDGEIYDAMLRWVV